MTTKRPVLGALAASLCASLACAASPNIEPATPVSPSPAASSDPTPQVDAPPAAPPAARLNNATPISLDAWRTIRAEGKAAAREKSLETRIASCKSFVGKHGQHQEAATVLEALADALVEGGEYNPEQLSQYIEQRCATDEDATQLPVQLVRDYYIKHELPVEGAVRLLREARVRLDSDWKEQVSEETDERARKRSILRLSYRRIETYILEGRVNLQHGKPEQALTALGRAQAATASFPNDIIMVGSDGKTTTATLGSGLLDDLHVLTAAALHELGRDQDAKKALSRSVGFVNDVEMRVLYAKTQSALGLKSKSEHNVTAQALPAQDFALKNLAGKTVKLSDYRGKVVLVTFWATWCGPCKKEMPELQKFRDANKDNGVEVLAINVDGFTERAKVVPFLEKSDLDLTVLYEEAEQLSSYNYRGIPALYVIDREGRVAHARTGYDPDLKTKLNSEIAALVSGQGDAARDLFTVEMAPKGFGVLWKRPVTGAVSAVAVAPPLGKAPGEVGVVGRKGLMRWSANGAEQSAQPLSGHTDSLHAADLDHDGKREWVVGGWRSLKVLDAEGKLYWDHKTNRMAQISAIADLNGDGFEEIIFRDDNRAIAMKAVPEALWKTEVTDDVESVVLTASGKVAVQAAGSLTVYDGNGKVHSYGDAVPEGRILRATVATDDGEQALYGGEWDSAPITGHDIDGDGRNDIVVSGRNGLVAYNADGVPILRIRGKDTAVSAAIGDLDGVPGAEIAMFVEHYGLVVLGTQK